MNLILKILQKLNINAIQIEGPFHGYRNSSYEVTTKEEIQNLVIFNLDGNLVDTIQVQNKICTRLSTSNLNFQVRYPKSRIIKITTKYSLQYACLYNFIEGQTISWERYTARRLKEIGKCLKELHLYLNKITIDTELILKLSIQKQVCLDELSEMKNYYGKDGVKLAMYKKLGLILNVNFDKLERLISEIPDSDQLLHMDFVRGNIIWDDETQNKIVGIIDFEKMSRGKIEFDIARTLAFLIIDSKYKSEIEVRGKFLSAYFDFLETHRNVSLKVDMNLVENLVKFYLIYDFYKFLKYNPYEFLSQNEHFVRTRDYITKKDLLIFKD